MSDKNEIVEASEASITLPEPSQRIPLYRRNIFPTNVVLSAKDLADFCTLLASVNDRAQEIEFNNLDLSGFDSPQQARDRVKELVRVEYTHRSATGDSVQGLDALRADDLPDDLLSLFISNSTFTKRAVNIEPLNKVDAYLSFEKPSLKLDLYTLPSNPTGNTSVINVSGRSEDWVISTARKIENFFEKRKALRPVIHGFGAYNTYILIAMIPLLLWLMHRHEWIANLLHTRSTAIGFIVGLYVLLAWLFLGRFVFQYLRWLFPPMEYYKDARWRAYAHRTVAGVIIGSLLLSAAYDIAKSALSAALGMS